MKLKLPSEPVTTVREGWLAEESVIVTPCRFARILSAFACSETSLGQKNVFTSVLRILRFCPSVLPAVSVLAFVVFKICICSLRLACSR